MTIHRTNLNPFLAGGGGMGVLIRARDWAATPLGPPASWPTSLRKLMGVMLDAQQPMFIAWGAEGTLLYNDAYALLLGRKHPDALGRPLLDVWSEIRDDLTPLFDRVFAGEPVCMDDITLVVERHGRPEEAHFAFSYTPVRDTDGSVQGLFCACMDTTAQVLAERKRRAETERQQRLFERAPGFICALSGPQHVFEFVNDAHKRLFGDRDWIGNAVRDALPELEGQGFFELLDRVYSTGERFVAHGAVARVRMFPDAPEQERFLDFIYEPVTDEAGRVNGIFCEGHDVTAVHRASEALRESEARLRELNADLERQVTERSRERGRTWQVSPDLLSVIDPQGRFESTNPAWQAALGWSAEELGRTPWSGFVHPDDLDRSYVAFEEVRRGNPVLRFENRYRRKSGGYRWLSWVAVPEDGKFYCSARDVTEEHEQAAALAQAEDALRQSQKMEAVGQLTGGLAHDFNNLLTGITGSLELLQARLAQGRMGDVDRYVTAAQGAAKRAAALTHRLLAFSRRQTLDPKPTDVNRLVAGMEELVRRTVGPEVAVEAVAAGGLWTTLVDPNQLESALLNLCINARDAMPGGGRLTVETANRWLDERAARERDLPPGQYVSLCVSDTGTGMTPEVVARAFDPFFTTKPIGMGTGLGLSMTYGFVRQSGGQARIYSEPGEGAMVCLYLPRHHGEAESADEPDGPAVAPRAEAGETVLVVDDEPTVRMLVAEVLQELGCTVIEAADGAAGLRVLRSDVRLDLLVTDVGLPGGMNGRQLAEAARERRPGLRVLFITGYAENAVLSHGHLAPGMHVMTKPFAMEALASRAKDLLDRG